MWVIVGLKGLDGYNILFETQLKYKKKLYIQNG